MAHYKLKAIGGSEKSCGYWEYMDEQGRFYTAWHGQGELEVLRTLARLNWWGERDMPIFTKEFCEYQGCEREQYDTVEFLK